MKIPFVEFYPFTFVTKEQNSVAEYSPILKLPDLVQLRNYKAMPPFRQQSSSKFKVCKVMQNLRCGHEDTCGFEMWSQGHSQI